MSRIINVARMQWINRATFVTIPLLILGAALLISLLIYWIIPVDGPKYGGGAQAPLWYFLVIGIQALTLTFPFSLAMSVTRREFFFGSMLAALAVAFPISIVFVLGGLIESATNGWWINGWMFHLPWVWEEGPFGAWLLFLAAPILFFTAGFCLATIYKRFGSVTLTLTLVGLGAVAVAALAIVRQLDAWAGVGVWLASISAVGLALGLLLASVLVSTLSMALLQRATP